MERHLAEPIGLIEDIERLVLLLAASLKQDLERRGEGARALELCLFRVDGAVSRIAVGASMPLREPRLIGKLFHERLAALETSIDAGYGFDLVRLSAFCHGAFETEQGDLAGETASDDEDIALFADRVRARLGRDTLLKPMLVESHLPERAASLVPFDETQPGRVEPPRPGKKRLPPPAALRPSARSASSPSRADRRSGDRSAGRSAAAFPLAARPAPGRARRRARTHRAGMVAARKATAARPGIISASRIRTAIATGFTGRALRRLPGQIRAGTCKGFPHERTPPPYAEFAVQSNFSFLRGASKPEELVVAA